MLPIYYEPEPDLFTPWTGQPVNDTIFPYSDVVRWSSEEVAAIGLHIPADADPVAAGQRIVATAVKRAAGVVKQVHDLETTPLADRKVERLAELAQRRWEIETAGVTVGELTVPSDRETQDRIDQIVKAYADGDITGAIMFKLGPGQHIAVDEATLRAVKAEGALHIQQCFSREAELAGLIVAAADLAALEAIDVQGFWA